MRQAILYHWRRLLKQKKELSWLMRKLHNHLRLSDAVEFCYEPSFYFGLDGNKAVHSRFRSYLSGGHLLVTRREFYPKKGGCHLLKAQ